MVQHVGEFELCISWRPKKVKKQEVADKEEDFRRFSNPHKSKENSK